MLDKGLCATLYCIECYTIVILAWMQAGAVAVEVAAEHASGQAPNGWREAPRASLDDRACQPLTQVRCFMHASTTKLCRMGSCCGKAIQDIQRVSCASKL